MSTGKILGQTKLFTEDGATAPSIHSKNSHASPTPLVVKDRVFVHFGHMGTACTDLSGNVLWKNTELAYPPVHGNGGSPIEYDDKIIFTCDGAEKPYVVALYQATGEIAWKTPRNVEADRAFSFATPLIVAVGGKDIAICPGSNVVQGLDPENGKEIWRLIYDGYSVIPRPIEVNGLVVICTGYNRPSMLAIDPSGEGDVTSTHLKWKVDSNVPHTSSPAAKDGLIFMVSDRGIASCIDSKDGSEVWRKRLGGNFSASVFLSGDHVYFQSEEGNTTILTADREGKELATNQLPGRTFASFAVADSDLLIRSEKAMYRISGK